jgi:hypothetical protein
MECCSERYGKVIDAAKNEGKILHEIEMMKLGTDHAEIGEALGDHWNLPSLVTNSIGSHHTQKDLTKEIKIRVSILQLANDLAKIIGIGESGNYVISTDIFKKLNQKQKISEDNIKELIRKLPEDIVNAEMFFELKDNAIRTIREKDDNMQNIGVMMTCENLQELIFYCLIFENKNPVKIGDIWSIKKGISLLITDEIILPSDKTILESSGINVVDFSRYPEYKKMCKAGKVNIENLQTWLEKSIKE